MSRRCGGENCFPFLDIANRIAGCRPAPSVYQLDEQLPTISKSWRLNWERLTPFMSYPAEIRRAIYTTNAIESVNSSLRKVLKNRGSFPNEDLVIKLVYLALRNIGQNRSLPIRDWASAMNRFAIMFEGRMPVH